MKQILLIITLFIGFGNANAQDATNDATWGETIEFINKHKSNMYVSCKEDRNINFKLNTHENTMSYSFRWMHYETAETIHLEEVEYIEDRDNKIFLSLTGELSKTEETRYSTSITKKYELTGIYIYTCETKIHPRLVKAFKHLSYLAGINRKKSKF